MIKLVIPGIITVAIFTFINAANEFLAALILMSDNKNYTLSHYAQYAASGQHHQAGAHNVDYGALQAGVHGQHHPLPDPVLNPAALL